MSALSTKTPSRKAAHLETSLRARHAQKQREQQWKKASHYFARTRLPIPAEYFKTQGLTLKGRGAWRDAVCPFHTDTKPSLRVKIKTGAFSCMACGAHGGDVLAYHMKLHNMDFKTAAVSLGAWVGGAK